MENDSPKEVEALCKECGHGFKASMDRVLAAEQDPRNSKDIEGPVCGCGDCKSGQERRVRPVMLFATGGIDASCKRRPDKAGLAKGV